MKIDVIHISEIEQIEPNNQSNLSGFMTNSWCVSSFLDEWHANAEVSVGTHDKKALSKREYTEIPLSNPPVVRCPYPLYMKTASPIKIFTGKVVMHPETLEISKIFSTTTHSPTVAFIYHPSRLPRQILEGKEWKKLPRKVFDESNAGPLTGSETMGATLISSRDDIPPRWFGSIVTCEQEREIGANSNPTILQVAAGIISHLVLLLENPQFPLHFSGIDVPDGFHVICRIAVESLFQISLVTDALWDQTVPFIHQPGHISQILSCVEKLFALPFGKFRHRRAPSRLTLWTEHGRITGPWIIRHTASVVQGISGNIGKRIPDMPVILKDDSTYRDAFHRLFLAMFTAEPH